MTGEKNRYSSVEKLWKLDDETLKTPKHDEMVIWLMNTENTKRIFPEVREYLEEKAMSDWYQGDIRPAKIADFWKRLKRGEELEEKEIEDIQVNDIFHPTDEEIINDWARILTDYNSFKGYLPPSRELQIIVEKAITTENRFIVGYWDVVIYPGDEPAIDSANNNFYRTWSNVKWKRAGTHRDSEVLTSKSFPKIYVEVKPKINSFGATLRQLRTYQVYVPKAKGNTYLFTFDLRFKEAFESQGIKVIDANRAMGETQQETL